MIDYIRDGQAIYRQSFATIRAEANLAGIPADLEKLAVRVIHACGMVDVVDDLRFSPGAGAAGRPPRRGAPPARSGPAGGGAPGPPPAPPPPPPGGGR
ncbi:precorrin-8X methylmutase, partial [Pseudomonas aeruginosa]|uniref:precorrin-8X methylmutase n=2 Tax=Pseudomonas aeruginosa TaxID=287 RepID=UPI0021F0C3B1